MNIKTILVAVTALMGAQYLGYSVLYGLIAFNMVIWLDIVYNLFFSTTKTVQGDIFEDVEAEPKNAVQVAFDRWLIQKYLESLIEEAPVIDEGVQLLEDSQLVAAEA